MRRQCDWYSSNIIPLIYCKNCQQELQNWLLHRRRTCIRNRPQHRHSQQGAWQLRLMCSQEKCIWVVVSPWQLTTSSINLLLSPDFKDSSILTPRVLLAHLMLQAILSYFIVAFHFTIWQWEICFIRPNSINQCWTFYNWL